MSKGWGSHWRWMLLVVVVSLIGARYVVARSWKNREMVIDGGGPPALVRSSSLGWSAVEAWDWRSNKTQTLVELALDPPPEGMRLAGDRLVWLAQGTLYTAHLGPPLVQRHWKLPFEDDPDSLNRLQLVGTSADHRYAVVQCQPFFVTDLGSSPMHELAVVDLATGEVASSKSWQSVVYATPDGDQFESRCTTRQPTDVNEAKNARWRLTDQGQWEQLPSPTVAVPRLVITIVKDANGKRRSLKGDEAPNPGEQGEDDLVVSPDQEHYLSQQMLSGEIFLTHRDSPEVHSLGFVSAVDSAYFTNDRSHVVVVDANDDIRVFEAVSGRLIASDSSGLFWRRGALGIAIAWSIAAVAWFVLAWRQEEVFWAAIDLHAAGITAQLALFGFLNTLSHSLSEGLTEFSFGAAPAVTAAFGMGVGWYWIHADVALVTRLKEGLLSVAAIALAPAVVILANVPPSTAYAAVAPPFAGLFVASVTAMILAPVSMSGWRVHDRPITPQGRSFGLASMMLMITGAAVVMGFVKLELLPSFGDEIFDIAIYLVPVFTMGLLLPGLVLSNLGWLWQIALGTVVAVFVGGVVASGIWWRLGPASDPYMMLIGFQTATALAILCISILVRKFGWRWRRAELPTPSPAAAIPSLEAAA